jgi:hypothetical protein
MALDAARPKMAGSILDQAAATLQKSMGQEEEA